MKIKKRFLTLLLVSPLVFSCAETPNVPYDSDKYVVNIKASNEEFVILQLTDIHWTYNTLVERASSYLSKVVSEAIRLKGRVDLIEVTGDMTFIANKNIATQLYDLIDSWNIPWAVAYGNHDFQGSWSTSWLNETTSKRKNALFPNVADNLSGETNYVINVSWDDKVAWQIYNLDTKSLKNNSGSYDYDCIREDQVDWYVAQAEKTKTGSKYIPSLAYFHIPFTDVYEIFKDESKKVGGYVYEKEPYYFAGKTPSSFYEKASARGLRGAFFGHDHSNDVVYKDNGIAIGYGVKSNTELYSAIHETTGKTLTGGALVTIHKPTSDSDTSYNLKHFYIDDANIDEGVYDSWEVTI